jgi:hypothetical protein
MKKAIRDILERKAQPSANTRRFRAVLNQALRDSRAERREARAGKSASPKQLKNKRRVIEDGRMTCLDCGPRPVAEFSTVIRKSRRYFDSRCDACRKIRCIARNHNISPSKYRELLALSGGKCAVCGEAPEGKLCLDHSHTTGQLRGVLCSRCNWALAPFDGNVEFGDKLLNYLRYWAVQPMTADEIVEGLERERRMKRIRDRVKGVHS